MKSVACLLGIVLCASAQAAVEFQVHSAKSGNWSDLKTWAEGRLPMAGERVQIREGHRVVYDVESGEPIRMIHVAGAPAVLRGHNKRLHVGVLRVSAGGFGAEDTHCCPW